MRSRKIASLALALALLALLAVPSRATAQPAVTQYTLYDVGTLGGNFTTLYNADLTGGFFTPIPLNNRNQVAVISLDANSFAASGVWGKGKLQKLPSFAHANDFGGGSNAFGINDSGVAVGISDYGKLSQFNQQPLGEAVMWSGGKITRLGDLGGQASFASSITNQGLVVGLAYNGINDFYSYYGKQLHAVTWQQGKIRDLGTLGGTDSQAWTANASGEVIGISFLNTNPLPPFNQPQDDAFVWSNGKMKDIGTLGGSFSTPSAINSSGQVSVISLDATNSLVQGFLWFDGTITNLQSLGGHNYQPLTLNDSGTSVGAASDASDLNYSAAMWQATGAVQSLGTVAGDSGSIALGINSQGVVVGGSGTVTPTALASYAHAFVWQGGAIQDLNTLIPAGSPLTLNVAYAINESGAIAGLGTTSAGDTHVYVLVPVTHRGVEPFIAASSAPAAPGSSLTVRSPLVGLWSKPFAKAWSPVVK